MTGSGMSEFLRFIVAAFVESSMYLSCIAVFPDIGLGIGVFFLQIASYLSLVDAMTTVRDR